MWGFNKSGLNASQLQQWRFLHSINNPSRAWTKLHFTNNNFPHIDFFIAESMLKLISSSCIQSRVHRLTSSVVQTLRPGTESNLPLHKLLNSIRGLSWNNPSLSGRVFFCSGSDSNSGEGSGSEQAVESEVKAAENSAEEAGSKAIVSTNPRPEDYLTVSFGVVVLFGGVCSVAEWFKDNLNNPQV